jgi:hypothetical protein
MNATITRRVNVTLGGAVHAGTQITVNGKTYAANPVCGGNHGSARYKITTRGVSCKNCVKAEVARAAEIAPAEVEAYEMAAEIAAAEVEAYEMAAVLAAEVEAYEMAAVLAAIEVVETAAIVAATVIMTDQVTTGRDGVLSGPFKTLKRLYESGAARMNDEGDLVWAC